MVLELAPPWRRHFNLFTISSGVDTECKKGGGLSTFSFYLSALDVSLISALFPYISIETGVQDKYFLFNTIKLDGVC